MTRILLTFAIVAGLALLMAGNVHAGMPSKGLKIDPMLQQAIEDSAGLYQEEEPKEMFGPPIPPPEPEPRFVLPELPEFPVYVEEEPEKDLFDLQWPNEPGLMFNGMRFLPELLVKAGWNDNIYATDTRGDTDLVTYIVPSLKIEIPDIRHEFLLEGSYEVQRYLENDDEDQTNLRTKMEGALVAEHGMSVPFMVSYNKVRERREDDLTQQMSLGPLSMNELKLDLGIEFKPGKFGIAFWGKYQKDRFEDGISRLGRAPIVRRDADRDITDLQFHTSFDIDPENTLLLWGTYGQRDYDQLNYQSAGFNGPRRSSDTFGGMLSWMFDYKGFIDGHITLGVSDYNYEDPTIMDVRELVGDMEFNHYLGEFTTINLQLERSIMEDDEVIDPIILSRAGLYIDHQAWSDVLIAVGADYNFMEFNNSGRDDERWDFRVLTDYFFNNYLSFGGEYRYSLRNSEINGLDFNRNIFLLRARGRL